MPAQAFDLVITDYEQRQGRVNGAHVLAVFNNLNPRGGKLLITGHLPGELADEQTLGAIHMTKPIDLDDLLLNVKTLLQS
jgi:DNA-binding NtrC family response regulator